METGSAPVAREDTIFARVLHLSCGCQGPRGGLAFDAPRTSCVNEKRAVPVEEVAYVDDGGRGGCLRHIVILTRPCLSVKPWPSVSGACYPLGVTLRFDAYPAEAVLPDGRLIQGSRVQVTRDGRVVVWENWTGVARVAYVGKVIDHSRYPERGVLWNQKRVIVRVDGGSVIANQTGPGDCRCGGSPLYDLTEADAKRVLGIA